MLYLQINFWPLFPLLLLKPLTLIFSSFFEAITSTDKEESSWHPRYSIVLFCLSRWPAKDMLIYFKPKGNDLGFVFPQINISWLSRKHSRSNKNFCPKNSSIFWAFSCWEKINNLVLSSYKQFCRYDWGKSFLYKTIKQKNNINKEQYILAVHQGLMFESQKNYFQRKSKIFCLRDEIQIN